MTFFGKSMLFITHIVFVNKQCVLIITWNRSKSIKLFTMGKPVTNGDRDMQTLVMM